MTITLTLTPEEEAQRQSWASVMFCAVALTSCHIILKFTFTESRAVAIASVHETFTLRQPGTALGKLLLGRLTRCQIVQNDVRRSTWISTREGWLCQSDITLSHRLRLRCKTADTDRV